MKKTLLGLAMSCVAGAALANDYDDRWMLSTNLIFNALDGEKSLESDFGLGLGLGKFINNNWSLDVELDHVNVNTEGGVGGSVDQTGLGLMTRYHFAPESSMRPFLGFGAGYLDHNGSGNARAVDSSDFMLNLSAGLRKSVTDRVSFLTEVKYRLDADDFTGTASSYDDFLFSMGMSIALGAARETEVAEPIVEPAPQLDSDGDGVSDQSDRCPNTPAGMTVDMYGCHQVDGDDDNDGVSNSMDKCPDSRPGAVVDADGCEVQVVIELQGVYFDLDKATLKPESIRILDAAVKTMGDHGTLVVEVAGHTDSTASEAYNQALSERRAKVVYEYLVSQGVSADRMTWKGYGELSPIATNDTEEGRAKNRRTELVIQD